MRYPNDFEDPNTYSPVPLHLWNAVITDEWTVVEFCEDVYNRINCSFSSRAISRSDCPFVDLFLITSNEIPAKRKRFPSASGTLCLLLIGKWYHANMQTKDGERGINIIPAKNLHVGMLKLAFISKQLCLRAASQSCWNGIRIIVDTGLNGFISCSSICPSFSPSVCIWFSLITFFLFIIMAYRALSFIYSCHSMSCDAPCTIILPSSDCISKIT